MNFDSDPDVLTLSPHTAQKCFPDFLTFLIFFTGVGDGLSDGSAKEEADEEDDEAGESSEYCKASVTYRHSAREFCVQWERQDEWILVQN